MSARGVMKLLFLCTNAEQSKKRVPKGCNFIVPQALIQQLYYSYFILLLNQRDQFLIQVLSEMRQMCQYRVASKIAHFFHIVLAYCTHTISTTYHHSQFTLWNSYLTCKVITQHTQYMRIEVCNKLSLHRHHLFHHLCSATLLLLLHSSQIQGWCSTKSSSEMLQNFSCFIYMKTQSCSLGENIKQHEMKNG